MESKFTPRATPADTGADWRELASALLDRVERPTLLVSPVGRVHAANRAFRVLAGATNESLLRATWGELFGDAAAEGGATLPSPLRSGEIKVHSGRLFARRFAITLEVETHEREPRRAFLVQVIEARPLEDSAERAVLSRSYVVSRAPHSVGVLVDAQSDDGHSASEQTDGERSYCYEAMHGADEPCEGCPVFEDAPELPTRRALAPSAKRQRYCVVEVSMLDGERLKVETTCLAKDVVSELIQAKVAWVASESALTAREREVLNLLYIGRCTRDIAMLLEVSERTVKYHQANVLRKLGADSRVDLVRLLL